MYFHLLPHVYVTYFNEQVIALDLIKNQYKIISEELSASLYFILKNEFKLENEKYAISNCEQSLPPNFESSLQLLRELQLLSKHKHDYPDLKTLERYNMSIGAENIDWRMTDGDLDKKISVLLVLKAYYSLTIVYFILKVFGFNGLIKSIKSMKKKNSIIKNSDAFKTLVTALNRACFFFPVRTKCLEWSAALTMMALKNNWECKIEIGVQNLPFKAHAWVKANGEVIADTPDLPKTLSVILSEPL